jgi:hydrogenase maturation protease
MILVAGIGNTFLGDNAFGSDVARRLSSRIRSTRVRVVDFGIRSLDLLYSLLDGYDATIIVDTTRRGGEPGTIYVIEPDLDELKNIPVAVEIHDMDPMRVLAMAHSMGAALKNIRIVGCEPETFGPADEGQMGLSPRVVFAAEQAVEVIEELIETFETFERYRRSA